MTDSDADAAAGGPDGAGRPLPRPRDHRRRHHARRHGLFRRPVVPHHRPHDPAARRGHGDRRASNPRSPSRWCSSGPRGRPHRARPRGGSGPARSATGIARRRSAGRCRPSPWSPSTTTSTSSTARQTAAAGRAAGFSSTDLTLIATAISEIARNIISYAGRGEVRVRVLDARGAAGDRGGAERRRPGHRRHRAGAPDGYSTGRGWPRPARCPAPDGQVDRESPPGKGTVVEMWKWIPAGA